MYMDRNRRAGRVQVGLIIGLAIFAVALFVPKVVTNLYALHILILLLLAIAQGESWNILGGYAGQYSVGHAAYYGTGAYTTLLLLQDKIPPWYGALVGIGLSIVVALITGVICFRLRGAYFVLASIAVAEIMRLVAMDWKELTNGAEGVLAADIPPLKIGSFEVTDFLGKIPFYYIVLCLAAIAIIANILVQNSKLGYYLQAIREDQDAAHSLGINLSLYKNLGLIISAGLTSLAGSFYALYTGFIDPNIVLGTEYSIAVVLIAIIGGVGTVVGPVVGACVLVLLSEALRANLLAKLLFSIGVLQEGSAYSIFLRDNLAHAHQLIYGILVVVVILFMPDGVLGFIKGLFVRRPAAAKGRPVHVAP